MRQAIYLYIFRHGRLIDLDKITIGFKSARTRMAVGIGISGTPMSEGAAYEKLRSLQTKGCVEVLRTTHTGRLLKRRLPSEISDIIPTMFSEVPIGIGNMDFFAVKDNRFFVEKRELPLFLYVQRPGGE